MREYTHRSNGVQKREIERERERESVRKKPARHIKSIFANSKTIRALLKPIGHHHQEPSRSNIKIETTASASLTECMRVCV